MKDNWKKRCATLLEDGRLELTDAKHDLSWIRQDTRDAPQYTVDVIVRIINRGCLRMKTVPRIAEEMNISEKEVPAWVNSLGKNIKPPQISPIEITTSKPKEGPGRPVIRIRLPDVAIWALLGQGIGPLNPKKTKPKSVQVLVETVDFSLYVWDHTSLPDALATVDMDELI